MYTPKETYWDGKRDLLGWQKRPEGGEARELFALHALGQRRDVVLV